MATTHLEFLSEKMQTVSAGYTESVILSQQRGNSMAETGHNSQITSLITPNDTVNEVMSQVLSGSAVMRGAQPPIATPVS
jgi:hypothetical protein